MSKNLFVIGASLLLTALAFTSCDKTNKCQNIDCFTPPQQFIFDIVDGETETNVFLTGDFDRADVAAADENGDWENLQFLDYGDTNLLVLPEMGWNTGKHQYTISLDAETEINIVLEMQEAYENCCTFFRVIDFDVEDYEWYEVDNSELVRVKI